MTSGAGNIHNPDELISDSFKRGSSFNKQQYQNINQHTQDYQAKQDHQRAQSTHSQSFINETEMQLRESNLEVHRLRKSNAKMRDDYSRMMRKLQETQMELEQEKRNRRQMEVTKQKDYEYIIKQDRQLEQYQGAYSKIVGKYNSKSFS